MTLYKNEKHSLEDIFQRFIQPHFSITDSIIFFEWDRISRNYRHVVTPTADSNKFIRFYLNKGKTSADFEVVITYSSVNSFNFHHTLRLLFLLAHDDLERSNCFYQDLINDLDKKSSRGIPVDFLSPLSMREK